MQQRHLFTLSIDASRAKPFRRNGYDYVSLPSGTEYAVELHNHHNQRCDVELYIDGQRVGGWIAPAYETLRIERPSGERRKFTFFEEHSDVARSTGARVGSSKNGLVSAIFKPRKEEEAEEEIFTSLRGASGRASSPQRSRATSSMSVAAPVMSMARKQSFEAGVTVLGNNSDQTFGKGRRLRDDEIDWHLATEVSIRLVVADDQPLYIPISPSYPPRLD